MSFACGEVSVSESMSLGGGDGVLDDCALCYDLVASSLNVSVIVVPMESDLYDSCSVPYDRLRRMKESGLCGYRCEIYDHLQRKSIDVVALVLDCGLVVVG